MLTDEPILLQRISEGDQNAFRELFGYYYPKVRCFLAGFIENEDDVKDLSQNIFVKIWLMRSVLCDIRSFGPYLYRMCRNAAIDYGRRHQVKIPLTDRYEEETAPLDEDYFAREMSWQYSRQVPALGHYQDNGGERPERRTSRAPETYFLPVALPVGAIFIIRLGCDRSFRRLYSVY